MNEEQNNKKGTKKVTLKSFSKGFLVISIILFFAFFSIAASYVKFKDDMDDASETVAAYSTSVDSSGRIVYTYTDPEDSTITETVTPEDIAEDLAEVLGEYISGDEEEDIEVLTYLIEAETVVKQPYIDSLGEEELNGRIKFYRYTETQGEINAEDLTEENRLKYMPLAEFNAKLEAYRSNASANRDIFKHFTIDDQGTVLVAYGTEEYRYINTGVDGGSKDRDLSTDIINESSTATNNYTGNCDSGFSTTDFKIFTKPVDYLSIVENYVMPFNLLNSLLIQTADQNFVKEVASLAYESEIAIGIYDNTSYSETIQTYTYKKLMKVNVQTSFDYKDTLVSITDSQPSIILEENDLASSPYEYIPIKCETQTTDDGQIQHKSIYKKEGSEDWASVTGYKMYIDETNANNEIIALGEGETYNTKYKRTIDSMSTPTIGVLYADTWIAKWESSYTREETAIPESTTPETALENKEITSYTNDNILTAFSDSAGISSQLIAHAEERRRNTISSIINSTPEDIFVVEPSTYTITEADSKNVLKEHLEACSTCRDLVRDMGYSIGDENINVEPFFEAVMSPRSSEASRVKQHFNNAWGAFNREVAARNRNAEQYAEQKTRERKATFEAQLNVEGAEAPISYIQTLSGNKQYVNILTSSSSSGSSSRYEKSETITRTEDGEKFSVIFNDQRFHETKMGIINRVEWFWEYIRENEDTAKLEDTLRYLLNIATESTSFGTFTEEEIEALFNAFEPNETININTIYGSDVETKLWYALSNEGYSAYAIAGVLGNIWAESEFKSNNLEGSYESVLGYTDETYTEAVNNGSYSRDQFISDHNSNNCGAGYGLAQWTYYTRKAGLYDFAKSRGVSIDDEDMQIEYLIGEITCSGGADGYASYVLSEYNGYTVDDWINAESPEDAATAFCWIFEKPGTPRMTERTEKAREYYDRYSNAEGGIFIRNTSEDERIIGTFTSSITGRTFTIFKQSRIEGWSSSCNRAAQISICSGYWEGSVDELIQAGREAPDNTAPGYQALYTTCGLTYSVKASGLSSPYTFDSNQIKQQIQNGGYAVIYVRGTNQGADGVSKYGRDWANVAHWVAILGYREINGVEEMFVSDSGHNLSGWVPLDEFDGITNHVFFVNE